MNESKICPLMCIAGNGGICIKERCAWWDGLYCRCAVLTIAANLNQMEVDRSHD